MACSQRSALKAEVLDDAGNDPLGGTFGLLQRSGQGVTAVPSATFSTLVKNLLFKRLKCCLEVGYTMQLITNFGMVVEWFD